MNAGKPKIGLQRQLSPAHVWSIAFGCIIGWGAFVNPGKKFLPNSGVDGTTIAMLLGALVMIVIAFSYAYMVPRYPKAGGEFTFAKTCFGRNIAFVCGWFLMAAYLTNVPMNSTAIGLIVDGLDGPGDILKWGFHYKIAGFDVWCGEMMLAMGILLFLGWLNIIGVKKAGVIQTLLATLLALSVVMLAIAALVSASADVNNLSPVWGFDKTAAMAANATVETIAPFAHVGRQGIITAVLATFAITPWAFVGFETIPQAVEEFKFSYSKVMVIMTVAILFGAFVYIANNYVAAIAVREWPDKVIAGEWVLLCAAENMLGVSGKVLLGIAVSSAVLSGIMGFYLASSRLMFSMAREGYLPKIFAKIDERYGTPRNAVLFCIVISLSGPILGREALGWFVDMSAIGASVGFFFTSLSGLYTMKSKGEGGVLLKTAAMAGAVFSVLFVLLQLVPIPGFPDVHYGKESYIMLLVWIALGSVFLMGLQKRNRE